jgi:hypothetical protein
MTNEHLKYVSIFLNNNQFVDHVTDVFHHSHCVEVFFRRSFLTYLLWQSLSRNIDVIRITQ